MPDIFDSIAPDVMPKTGGGTFSNNGDIFDKISAPMPAQAMLGDIASGVKRYGEAAIQGVGKMALDLYQGLDPTQATSALGAAAGPVIAGMGATPPAVASQAVGKLAKTAAADLGASENTQWW